MESMADGGEMEAAMLRAAPSERSSQGTMETGAGSFWYVVDDDEKNRMRADAAGWGGAPLPRVWAPIRLNNTAEMEYAA